MTADLITPLLKILPVFLLIPLGYLLKKIKLIKKTTSKDLTKLFINVSLPAALLLAFSSVQFSKEIALLPLAGFSVNIGLMFLGFIIVRIFKLHKTIKNIFILTLPVFGTATIAFPFFIAIFGPIEGLKAIAFIEIGNIVFWSTFDHYLAYKLSSKSVHPLQFLKKMVKNPLLWAMVVGLLINLSNTPVVTDFLKILSSATVFLIMVALGLAFQPKLKAIEKTIPIILVKTSLGIMLAYAVGLVFQLTDFQFFSIIIYGAIPASAVTFAFAAETHIGKYFDAELLSIALPVGAVVIPVMMIFSEFITSAYVFLITLPVLFLGFFLMKRWD